MQRLSLLHHLHERLLPRCCAVGRFVAALRMNHVLYASGLWEIYWVDGNFLNV